MKTIKYPCGLFLALILIFSSSLTSNQLLFGQADTKMQLSEANYADEPTLDEIKKAAEKYRDVSVALTEGYIADPMNICETAEAMGRPAEDGAMGIHYFRPDLLQITGTEPRVNGIGTHTDFLQPAVLIYEPQADDTMELIAVENLVFTKAWYEAGHDAPPSFHGIPFDHMVNDPDSEIDEAHMFEEHFDRHVWVFRENPLGVFEPFNPNVTCKHHKEDTAMDMDMH